MCLCHLHHQKQDSDTVKTGTQASFGLCGLGAVAFILRGNVLHFYASFINKKKLRNKPSEGSRVLGMERVALPFPGETPMSLVLSQQMTFYLHN